MSNQDYILTKSTELFMKYGIKSLTIDDIAREFGMSKKTLYAHVENKSDLVYKSMQWHIEREECDFKEIVQNAGNAVEEMMMIVNNVTEHIKSLNTNIIFELQKFFPDTFVLFNEFREKHIRMAILSNLKRGVEEGFYREDLDVEIVSRIYVTNTFSFFDQNLFNAKSYQFIDLYREFMKYHLHGIVSAKGLKYIQKIKALQVK